MKFRLMFSIILMLLLASTVFGSTISYVYDELDRLHEVTLENGQKITYEYDQIGNMISKTGTSGVLTGTENGASGWSPQNLPISVLAGTSNYIENSYTISKTLNLRPGPITITGGVWGDGAMGWYGLKIDGTEVNLVNSTYNSSYTGSHLVELYVYAFDEYGDHVTSSITGVSIPVN